MERDSKGRFMKGHAEVGKWLSLNLKMVKERRFQMKCPKTQTEVMADDCEQCVSSRICYEWCIDHIVWGGRGEPLFMHEMGKYGEGLGFLLSPPAPQEPHRKEAMPLSLRWEIWERDNFTCQTCGSRQYLTIDHIIPESKGGKTEKDNLQTLCKACNARKGNRA